MTAEPEMTSIEAPTLTQRSPTIHWGTEDILEFPDYSDEEARNIWYDDFELAVIGNDAVRLAMSPEVKSSRTRKRANTYDNHSSMRGLEIMTVQGTLERLRAKVGIAAVLDEQERQRATGIQDEDAIALVSHAESLADVHRALALGIADQESADEILERIREPASTALSRSSKERPWFRRKSDPTPRNVTNQSRVAVTRTMKRLFGRSRSISS
jgi:hypothetical protein